LVIRCFFLFVFIHFFVVRIRKNVFLRRY
jgi:hypothetical protein